MMILLNFLPLPNFYFFESNQSPLADRLWSKVFNVRAICFFILLLSPPLSVDFEKAFERPSISGVKILKKVTVGKIKIF